MYARGIDFFLRFIYEMLELLVFAHCGIFLFFILSQL